MQRHDALLRAFAEHFRLGAREIDGTHLKSGRFGDARAACVQKLEHGLVAHVFGRLLAQGAGGIALSVHRKQLRHVGRTYDMRKAFGLLRALQRVCGIGIDAPRHVHPTEEATQSGKAAVDSRARILRLVELPQIAPKLPMRDGKRIQVPSFRPARVIEQIGAVSAHRVDGCVALYAHGLAKRVHGIPHARIAALGFPGSFGLRAHARLRKRRSAPHPPPADHTRQGFRSTRAKPRRHATRMTHSARACCEQEDPKAP